VVFNTGPYTVLLDNSILITANMQSETGFPSSHQLKSYAASKSRLKLAARAVLSADAGLLVPTAIRKLDFTVAQYTSSSTFALKFSDFSVSPEDARSPTPIFVNYPPKNVHMY